MIRIISGTHKGRRLRAPKNLPVRPTTDRAKEALFNILAATTDWPNSKVLDLFAGTGNISYEAASRGCPAITAVDAHPGCIAFIRKTAAQLALPITAIRQQAMSFLARCNTRFDLIFADPPYDMPADELKELVRTCLEGELLRPEGVMVVEHQKETDISDAPGFVEARKYGGSVFSFFG